MNSSLIETIDWSKTGSDLLNEIGRERRARATRNIAQLDTLRDRLMKEDIFDHNAFPALRPRVGTQRDWADACNMSPGTVRNYENGDTYPGTERRRLLETGIYKMREQQAHIVNLWNDRNDFPIDPAEAKHALEGEVLSAALTDFEFDKEQQIVRAVPFDADSKEYDIEQMNTDRRDLLDSLTQQGRSIANDVELGANANVTRLVQALRDYAEEAQKDRPNPRKMVRWGQNISRAAANDDIALTLNDWDREALDGFVSDHQDLARSYYKEALRVAQDIDAFSIAEAEELPDSDFFMEVAQRIEDAKDKHGQPLFDGDISVLLRDIARDVRDQEDNELALLHEAPDERTSPSPFPLPPSGVNLRAA